MLVEILKVIFILIEVPHSSLPIAFKLPSKHESHTSLLQIEILVRKGGMTGAINPKLSQSISMTDLLDTSQAAVKIKVEQLNNEVNFFFIDT